MADGYFQGGEYRILRLCWRCKKYEVSMDGETCFSCDRAFADHTMKLGPAPWYKRITMRGYAAIFTVVLLGLLALLMFVRGLH